MTKPTYEDALAFIEVQGIQLYDYQKELLKNMLEKETYYFYHQDSVIEDYIWRI
jgi:spore cortex formation protein SpoVR/YcgB (stage V sporulation)